MLLTFAAVASSADMCWPSVQLRNTAESISDGLPLTEAAIPTALWVGGLPCLRNGACCSKELYLGQGAILMSGCVCCQHHNEEVSKS